MVAAKVVAVAVGRDESSKGAVTWTLHNLLSEDDVLTLLHVRPPVRTIPTPLGSYVPIGEVNEEIVAAYLQYVQAKTDELFCPYRKLCDSRKVKINCVVVENDSIRKGVRDYMVRTGTQKLVLGHSVHSSFTRKFLGHGIAAYVAKHAPTFCTVLVISKHRLLFVKDANYSLDTPTSASESSNCDTPSDIVSDGLHLADLSNCFSSDVEINKDSRLQLVSPGQSITSQTCPLQNYETTSILKWMEPILMHPNESQLFLLPLVTPEASEEACYDGKKQSFQRILKRIDQLLERNLARESKWSSSKKEIKNIQNLLNVADSTLEEKSEYACSDHLDDDNVAGRVGSNLPYQCTVTPNHLANEDIISVEKMSSTTEIVRREPKHLRSEPKHCLANLKNFHEAVDLNKYHSTDYFPDKELQNCLALKHFHEQEVDDLKHQLKEALLLVAKAQKNVDVQAILRINAEDAALRATEQATEFAAKQFEEVEKRQEALMVAEMARTLAAIEADITNKVLNIVEVAKQTAKAEAICRESAEVKFTDKAEGRKAVMEASQSLKQNYRVYDYDELKAATENFSDHLKLGGGGYGSVYKGRLHHMTVAIKVLKENGYQGLQEFQREVKVLGRIHHPHVVLLLGCCPESGCLVYEYMANGSLEDMLICEGGTTALPWFIRFRIIAEVANAVHFLHSSRPEPIVHRDLKPGNILLDHNYVSKLSDVGLAGLVPEKFADVDSTYFLHTTPVGTFAYMDPEYQRTGLFGPKSDVYALGIVMLQLLTGKPPVGVHEMVEEALDNSKLNEVLDHSAGEWPFTETIEVAGLALQCAEMKRKHRPDLKTCVLPILDSMRVFSETFVNKELYKRPVSENSEVVPTRFLCPIFQEVMEDPVVAADGNTYDFMAIKQWLEDHNTSPITNVRLKHKQLTPNHSLRTVIREWQAKARRR